MNFRAIMYAIVSGSADSAWRRLRALVFVVAIATLGKFVLDRDTVFVPGTGSAVRTLTITDDARHMVVTTADGRAVIRETSGEMRVVREINGSPITAAIPSFTSTTQRPAIRYLAVAGVAGWVRIETFLDGQVLEIGPTKKKLLTGNLLGAQQILPMMGGHFLIGLSDRQSTGGYLIDPTSPSEAIPAERIRPIQASGAEGATSAADAGLETSKIASLSFELDHWANSARNARMIGVKQWFESPYPSSLANYYMSIDPSGLVSGAFVLRVNAQQFELSNTNERVCHEDVLAVSLIAISPPTIIGITSKGLACWLNGTYPSKRVRLPTNASAAAISIYSERVALGYDTGRLEVRNLANGDLIRTDHGLQGAVTQAAIDPGNTFAIAGDSQGGLIKVSLKPSWLYRTLAWLATPLRPRPLQPIAISPVSLVPPAAVTGEVPTPKIGARPPPLPSKAPSAEQGSNVRADPKKQATPSPEASSAALKSQIERQSAADEAERVIDEAARRAVDAAEGRIRQSDIDGREILSIFPSTSGSTRSRPLDTKQANPPQTPASSGLAVEWLSPFGPVRFDFSTPFEKQDYDKAETFRFSTSTNFGADQGVVTGLSSSTPTKSAFPCTLNGQLFATFERLENGRWIQRFAEEGRAPLEFSALSQSADKIILAKQGSTADAYAVILEFKSSGPSVLFDSNAEQKGAVICQ